VPVDEGRSLPGDEEADPHADELAGNDESVDRGAIAGGEEVPGERGDAGPRHGSQRADDCARHQQKHECRGKAADGFRDDPGGDHDHQEHAAAEAVDQRAHGQRGRGADE
jgi:hypothetical protein